MFNAAFYGYYLQGPLAFLGSYVNRCMHTHVYMYICTYIYVYMYICTHMNINEHNHLCYVHLPKHVLCACGGRGGICLQERVSKVLLKGGAPVVLCPLTFLPIKFCWKGNADKRGGWSVGSSPSPPCAALRRGSIKFC